MDVGGNHSRPAQQTDEAVRKHYKGAWAGATLLCSPSWWPFEECLSTVRKVHLNERQFGALSSQADQSLLLGQPQETWKMSPPPGKVFLLVPLDLPTAFLREVSLSDGNCPSLCFWAYQQEHLRLSMVMFPSESASWAPGQLYWGCTVCCIPRTSDCQCKCLSFGRGRWGRQYLSKLV